MWSLLGMIAATLAGGCIGVILDFDFTTGATVGQYAWCIWAVGDVALVVYRNARKRTKK
jgi:hypothetical protein